MNDKIVQAILNYLEQYSESPNLDWPEHWFEEVSFSRWAAWEILNAIMDNPMTPAEDTIEEFAFRMELYFYADLSNGRAPSRVFSIAGKTAREFLEMV